jgi:hypothetical protein
MLDEIIASNEIKREREREKSAKGIFQIFHENAGK